MSQRKVVVVSGGSAGIGRAIVREFADAGYDVAVLARGRAGVAAAGSEVVAADQRALSIPTDVADAGQVEAAAEQVEKVLGPIDVWVNVAFVGSLSYFWDTDEDLYRRITEVTYLGQVHGTRAALARMRPRNRGVIVQVGSALAYRGIPLQSAYCGAKHAVKGFTESVIAELKNVGSDVRVSMVQLPGVNTPQFDWNANEFEQHPMPVPPIFQPEVPARAVRYVAEHRRRNLWVGASTAYTILGNRLAPSLLDWYLGKKGVSGQLTSTDAPRHGANAQQPRDDLADRGAHGPFDTQAHGHDPWSWASMRRAPLAAAGAAATSAVLLRRSTRRSGSRA